MSYTPNTIQIEFVQGCNKNCSFCGTQGIEKNAHFMSQETLERIVSELQGVDWNYKILLAGHGEPTLHPEYLNMIQYIHQNLPGRVIHIMTNGYSVKKDIRNIEWMFYAGVRNLILDEYEDNPLRELLEVNNLPYEVNGQKGVKLFSDKMRIVVNPPIETKKVSVNRDLTNHCGAALPPLQEPKQLRCAYVFRELTIRWDGNVAICCDDFRGEYGVANIHDMSIGEIWMHPRFESARKFLYHKQRYFFPCSVCATSPIRAGLLPDRMGKEEMPEPTQEDWEIVSYKTEPYAKIVKREWEK